MTKNSQYNWTANRIHSLRLRLGWSKSDLARRLDCPIDEVSSWELSQISPPIGLLPMLEFIEKQAEFLSVEVHVCPLAESELTYSSRSQMPMDELI